MSKKNNTNKIKKSNFTDEQYKYIVYDKFENTKLLASAGSGKTHTLINRMTFLIEEEILPSIHLLMLTFSRFTRDDFLNRIKKMKIECIDQNQIKTIDSFSKNLIDENNEIDVSLLSYKFMIYLENSTREEIKENEKLKNVKCIFVDEAQDLNMIQFKILMLLKEKNDTVINLIGDPNQSIYQFRKSSDKYLTNFTATTFYLTKNFRSYDSVIEFSKYLRPIKNLEIKGNLGKSHCLPTFIFHQNDTELEKFLIDILKNAKIQNIDFSDIAILAPTRGRMLGYGRSHGLCLISNLLYKNKVKFKQFYEETNDDQQTGIKYEPEKGHINVLTFMGSKGLEWKFVILIDADVCLINKRFFSKEKHDNDQYLLYVACSRAIENIIIFSKYKINEGNLTFQLNPWFELIPKECYTYSQQQLNKYFKYPKVIDRDMRENEKKITKILDKIDEELLDELATICKYGINNKSEKIIEKIYDNDYSVIINSNSFLGKYVENLFSIYYGMKLKMEKKRYIDIENIINKKIITDISLSISEWYYKNRENLTWDQFDKDSKLGILDNTIVETVNNKFNRNQQMKDHTIVNDGYFKSFILSLRDKIDENYSKYLLTKNTKKIRVYLFNIMVILYSLDTQHYFHVLNKGKKFQNILTLCDDMFNKVKKFAYETNLDFKSFNVLINNFGLSGEIDLITKSNEIWEIKCTSDISLKHILQVVIYNIMYHNINENYDYDNKKNITLNVNFINFLKGEKTTIKIILTKNEIERIKDIFIKVSGFKNT